MNTIIYFFMSGCPYCRNADRAIEELTEEHPEYAKIPIERINEILHPIKAAAYDYYHVPTMFVGEQKAYEANPTQGFNEIKDSVRAVFAQALSDEKM